MMNNIIYVNGVMQRPGYDFIQSADGRQTTFHVPPAPDSEFRMMIPPTEDAITFHTGGTGSPELLRVAPDGFYVRGVKLEQDEKEAQAVYKAFKRFLVESELRRDW